LSPASRPSPTDLEILGALSKRIRGRLSCLLIAIARGKEDLYLFEQDPLFC
jgi:hypothetical protein